MKLNETKNRGWLYSLLAFLIPVIGMLSVMWIRGFVPFGDTSMLYSDMYHQYYPFFVSFRRALLSGESLLFNWDVGMGLNYVGLIAYYLGSPLNLLSVFIPEGYLLEYFSLLVPMKLGFASLFFSIFLRKLFHKNDISVAFFGAFYGLCAWALAYQWNVMWLDTFALLPLVVLGAIALLQNKKFILYTITLSLSVLINYYIGLFTCIFIALLFVCYQICNWKNFQTFILDFGRIALYSLLAVGITAFLTLPAYIALQSTQSGINTFPQGFQLNIADSNTWSGLFDAMRQVVGNQNGGLALNFKEHTGLPNIYCGVISTTLACLYLTCKQIRRRERFCAVGLLFFFNISFILRQLDYIWHGFHFTNMIPYRFSFLYSFVLLYMAYRAYLLRKNFRPWQIATAGTISLIILLCGISQANQTYWIFNITFILLYFVSFVVPLLHGKIRPNSTREHKQNVLSQRRDCRLIGTILTLGIMSIELVLNLVCFGTEYTGVNIQNYPEGTKYSKLIIQYMHERSDEDDFYRSEVTQTQTLNDGALNGYHGITTFTSSANVNMTRFTQVLGLSAKDTYNRYSYEEGSPVANLFLNLRYMINRRGTEKENAYFDTIHKYGTTQLLENNAYLPLGFCTDPQLLSIDFEKAYDELDATRGNWNNLSFQNKLFSAATGIDVNVWDMLGGNQLSVTTNNVTVDNRSNTVTRVYETDSSSGGTVTYRYVANTPGYACIDLYIGLYNSTYNANNHFSVWKNGVELCNDYYSLPQVLGVADVQVGDVIELQISCYANEHGLITAHCGILNESVFRRGYEKLNKSTLEIDDFHNTKISGTVTCNNQCVLYTSIPQDGNWVAYVDEKKVETITVGNAVVGVLLGEGQHRITFKYENQAFTAGLCISLASAFIFIILCIIYKRKKPGSQ